MIGLSHYLVLSALLFSLGLYGVLTRKNAVGVLMAIELMFNSVNLNLMAFSHYLMDTSGMAFAIFVITVAAAEVTVGVALVLSVYRNHQTILLDQVADLKG